MKKKISVQPLWGFPQVILILSQSRAEHSCRTYTDNYKYVPDAAISSEPATTSTWLRNLSLTPIGCCARPEPPIGCGTCPRLLLVVVPAPRTSSSLQNLYLLVGGLARKLTSSDDDIRVHAFLAMNKIADVVGIKERTREPRFLNENEKPVVKL